jgi:8-oxo-dGTP pyrophosphatase MutT (NUDIX family)
MLLRAANGCFETFLLRRSARSAFAPDAYVFPGGALDDDDFSIEAAERTLDIDATRLHAEFRGLVTPHDAAALCIAALRELFEEAGVLFARPSDGGRAVSRAALADARARLRAGEASFPQVLRDLDRRVDAGALAFFSRWVTPPSEPRRYDTYFFVARMPDDQTPVADADETHDGRWIAPREALADFARGVLHLVYPTIKHLERLAAFDDLDAAIAFARSKPVITVAPYTSPQNGFKMPPELEGVW